MLRSIFLLLGLLLLSPPSYAQLFVVTMDDPQNGAAYGAPASISVAATATADDGVQIQSMQLFKDGALIASGPGGENWASIAHTVSNLPIGTYWFRATATSNIGTAGAEVMVTVVNSPPTVSMNAPTGTFVAPATIGLSANAADSSGYVANVEFYANGAFVGSDNSAPYAINWNNVGVGSYTFTAKAIDNFGASATSSATSATVRAPIPNAQFVGQSVGTFMQPGATQTVTVQMKNTGELTWSSGSNYKLGSQNPENNGTWGTGGRAALSGSIAPGQTANISFTITAPTTPGLHNFQWRMLQEGVTWFGDMTANVGIQVNALPSVTLSNPTGNPYTAPATVNLAATASDSDGSVTRVEFYSNGSLIGTDTIAPYAMDWGGVGAGAYSVTAKAYDNTGAVNTSSPVSVSVNNALPNVSLGAPTGSPFIAPATIGLTATASDPDGSISKVEFYAGSTLVGTDASAPFATTWNSAAAGTYSLTARAYDNVGAFKNSSASSLTISSTAVIGHIDAVRQVGAGYQIVGWACSTGRNQSIDVHLYAGGAAGSGTYVGAYTANVSSETGVATACQAQGTAYGFQIPVATVIREQHANRKIYIHGISPDGMGNLLIDNSGALSIPGLIALSRRYVYDSNQQLCKVIEPETGSTVMEYDGAGNLAWSASGLNLPDPSNCNRAEAWTSDGVVLRDYYPRNTLKTLSFSDGKGDQTWTYTLDGLPAQIVTSNDSAGGTQVVNSYSYNKRRLLVGESVSQPGWYTWGIGYGYDRNGSLSGQGYPTELYIDYAPNALGQPTRAGSYASGVKYYPNGGIKQFSYGNGLLHTMGQNARQLPARTVDGGGALDHGYSYDRNGNVERIDDYAQGAQYTRAMTYDPLDRLLTATSPSFGGDGVHRFAYDSVDNLRSWTLAGGKDYASYYYDPSNRLTNVLNGDGDTIVGLEYDPQGNLSNKDGQVYEFDFGNRLREVTGKETYRYDGQGRRVLNWRPNGTVTLSQYSQSGQVVYQENSSKTLAIENVYLAGSLVASHERNWVSGAVATKYQHTDALGSPVAVTNEAGQVIDRTQYEPYGAAIGKAVDGVGYTGHVMDAATGLTYMQQRYYDPSIGRFLSVDPVATDASTGKHFNRYAYTDNNPFSFVDPDGQAKAAVWIVRLVQGGVEKVARVSKERAVELRRQGGQELNIGTNRRQLSHQIENAANPGLARRDVAHDLKDGSGKGLPHYQTDGVRGHTFWGKLGVAAASVSAALDQVAEAAEYIPDAAPRPAEQADASRWNNAMGAVSEATGMPMPGVKVGQDGGFQGYFRVEGRIDSKRLAEELKK